MAEKLFLILTEENIRGAAHRIKINKAVGPDGIPSGSSESRWDAENGNPYARFERAGAGRNFLEVREARHSSRNLRKKKKKMPPQHNGQAV